MPRGQRCSAARGVFQTTDRTRGSCTGRRTPAHCTTRSVPDFLFNHPPVLRSVGLFLGAGRGPQGERAPGASCSWGWGCINRAARIPGAEWRRGLLEVSLISRWAGCSGWSLRTLCYPWSPQARGTWGRSPQRGELGSSDAGVGVGISRLLQRGENTWGFHCRLSRILSFYT